MISHKIEQRITNRPIELAEIIRKGVHSPNLKDPFVHDDDQHIE